MYVQRVDTGVAAGRRARTVGPYVVLTALDRSGSVAKVSAARYIARTPDGERTVLLSTPPPGVDPARFITEADASRYLVGRWALPAAECAGPGKGVAWHASPYVPVLPLPTVLAVHGGPLPEATVRALGVALAETLSVTHGQNLVHAGVSPAAVLVAHDGPRLGCFGAVRAAAPALSGIDAGALAPEQASGGMPRPLGDVYALGATLAYAATGSTAPERDEVPTWLRSVVAGCLARDPAHRPQLRDVVHQLASIDGPAEPPLGFGATERAAALLGPGWLPPRIVAALAHQAASVLAAETAVAAAGPFHQHP
ncbi:serine/threonine protein kinase [Streptomyces sp. NPDC016845]|uniref:serine/threonine protein kinase n=1 Tax=Streptomyces sp. NPDC016845 TaxID=3364972 RepID=UPI00379F52D9